MLARSAVIVAEEIERGLRQRRDAWEVVLEANAPRFHPLMLARSFEASRSDPHRADGLVGADRLCVHVGTTRRRYPHPDRCAWALVARFRLTEPRAEEGLCFSLAQAGVEANASKACQSYLHMARASKCLKKTNTAGASLYQQGSGRRLA